VTGWVVDFEEQRRSQPNRRGDNNQDQRSLKLLVSTLAKPLGVIRHLVLSGVCGAGIATVTVFAAGRFDHVHNMMTMPSGTTSHQTRIT
jgi:hypothetical protein